VATVTSLNGPVDDPKSSAMQVIANLVKNGFIKAILPGFQAEVRNIEPYRYRDLGKETRDEQREKEKATLKKEKEQERKQKEKEQGLPQSPDKPPGR